jgi:hypothetical protein
LDGLDWLIGECAPVIRIVTDAIMDAITLIAPRPYALIV